MCAMHGFADSKRKRKDCIYQYGGFGYVSAASQNELAKLGMGRRKRSPARFRFFSCMAWGQGVMWMLPMRRVLVSVLLVCSVAPWALSQVASSAPSAPGGAVKSGNAPTVVALLDAPPPVSNSLAPKGKLPPTASPLPLVALLGVLALGGALVLRTVEKRLSK